MEVKLQVLGIPELARLIKEKEISIDLKGNTIKDLIEELISRYGASVKKALLDEKRELDPVIQILVNGKSWIGKDRLQTPLNPGDSIILMMMIGGGSIQDGFSGRINCL